jgi:hypothetical protein
MITLFERTETFRALDRAHMVIVVQQIWKWYSVRVEAVRQDNCDTEAVEGETNSENTEKTA